MARLGDICDILDNKRVPITASNRLAGPYPYYGANGVQDYVADYIFDDELVLLAEDGGNFGSKDKPIAYRVSGKCWVNNHAHVLKPKEGLDVDYLCYSLMFYDVTGLVNGATRQKLTQADMRKMEIPLPPLDEQRKIAAVLDKVSDLIAKRRQQLDKLDTLVKARFVEMFGDPINNPRGWKTDETENYIDLLSGFPFDSSQYTEKGINICGGLIIMPQRIEWNGCKHWYSIEGYEEYSLQENDIVIALDRPWISEGFKIAMVDAEHLPALLIQRTARIRGMGINQFYLMHCFLLGGFDKHCNITGSLVPHISSKDIRSFTIMLPPLEVQEQFAVFVAQVNKSKMAIQRSSEALETLNKSLMQQYFG